MSAVPEAVRTVRARTHAVTLAQRACRAADRAVGAYLAHCARMDAWERRRDRERRRRRSSRAR